MNWVKQKIKVTDARQCRSVKVIGFASARAAAEQKPRDTEYIFYNTERMRVKLFLFLFYFLLPRTAVSNTFFYSFLQLLHFAYIKTT